MDNLPDNYTKCCCICQEQKDKSLFYKMKRSADGLGYQCKGCISKQRAKYWAENKEALKPKKKAHYDANRDFILAQKIDYWQREREAIGARRRNYYASNPDLRNRAISRVANREALKRDPESDKIDRSVVFDRDNGTCYLCGSQVDPDYWHMDHVHPVSKGGSHTYDNVRVTHPRCNLRKSDSLPQNTI
jgi:5-methylcytosine-specific restriction endonuclease McrA